MPAHAAMEMDLEFDPFSREMMESPYEKYRLLRKHAPVYFNRTRDFWAVTRYNDTRRVFKDYRTFSNKDGAALDGVSKDPEFFGTTMVIMDPPDHTKLRRQFNPGWTVTAVRKLEPMVRETTDELIEGFIEQGSADVAMEFCWVLPQEVIGHIVGVPSADRPWVRDRFMVAFKRGAGVLGIPEQAVQAARDLRGYFGNQVDQRRAAPRDDLLTFISRMENTTGAALTTEEVEGYCLMLYSAGVFTTASFLSTALYVLSMEDDSRRRLIEQPDIAPRAVEELLRFETPVQQFCRTAIADVELGGQRIRAGDRVAVFPGSANRDESVWGENAEELDFDRGAVKNVVFGDGVHTCLGSHLARLEGRIALTRFLRRIPEYEVSGSIVRTDRVNERGLVSLPVRFR